MDKIIFIDIDGVLNALTPYISHAHKEASGFETWEHFQVLREDYPHMFLYQHSYVTKYDINYSPELLLGLESLHSEGVEIRFLTTWGFDANDVFCNKTGFEVGRKWKSYKEFTPSGIFWDNDLIGSWWKHHVLKTALTDNPDKQVVFIDDIALMESSGLYEQSSYAAATRNLIKQHSNFMVVVPNPNIGISKHELETVLSKDFFTNDVFVSDREIGESDMDMLGV